MTPQQHWTPEQVLDLSRAYQGAAVVAAAADLDLFAEIAKDPRPAADLARGLGCDLRALTILLDALAALGLVAKAAGAYRLAPGLEDLLTPDGSQSVLAMAQHQANCMRRWAQLARTVKSGSPAECQPSVRGPDGDRASFIGAMDNVSAPTADTVIAALAPVRFERLLDVGGASGTWTIAFLRACQTGQATLFDLPPVIPMAERRLAAAGCLDRVTLVPGDFMADPLPCGADLAWVSAIVHQNSRVQNRALFANVCQALAPGGRIAIRDIVMEDDRVTPGPGALFAVNMLTATEGGGTFTLGELREDLESAGFKGVTLARRDPGMNSIVVATRS